MEGRIPDGLYITSVGGQNELHSMVTRVSEEVCVCKRICVHISVEITVAHLSGTVVSGIVIPIVLRLCRCHLFWPLLQCGQAD